MSRFLSTWPQRIFVGLVMGLGVVALASGFFVFPTFDDWHYAAMGLEQASAWRAVLKEYLSWNGRYTSAFLLTQSPLTWPQFEIMRAWMFLSFVLFWMSLACLMATVSGTKIFSKPVTFFSLLLALLLTFFQEYSGTVFFWFAGNVNYYLPWIFHLVHATLLIRVYSVPKNQNAAHFAALYFVSMVTCGFNEAAMLMALALNGFPLLCLWRRLSVQAQIASVLLLILTGICVALVVLAPGNAARAMNSANSGRLGHTIYKSLITSPGLFVRLLAQFPALFLMPALFWRSWSEIFPLAKLKFSTKSRSIAWLLLLLVIAALMAPSFWGHGGIPNARTHYYLALPVFLGFYVLIPAEWWQRMSRPAWLLLSLSLLGFWLKTPFRSYFAEPQKVSDRLQSGAKQWDLLESDQVSELSAELGAGGTSLQKYFELLKSKE